MFELFPSFFYHIYTWLQTILSKIPVSWMPFLFPVDGFKSLNNECVFHCKEELLCIARANIRIFMSNYDLISWFLFLKNIKPIV